MLDRVRVQYVPERGTLSVLGGAPEVHAAIGGRRLNQRGNDRFYYTPSLLVLTTLERVFALEFEDEATREVFADASRRRAILSTLRTASDTEGPSSLRPYQRVGRRFLETVERGILADDVGLGKTAQALLAVSEGPVVVIGPKYLRFNWQREIQKWRPDLILADPREKVQVNTPDDELRRLVYVLGYEEFLRVKEIPAVTRMSSRHENAARVGTLIVDEAHNISGHKSQRSVAVRALARKMRSVYLLTATPIRNTNANLWPLLNALDPNVWSSYWRFAADYCEVVEGPFGKVISQPDMRTALGAAKIRALKDVLEFYLLKREKATVMPELPDKIRLDIPVPLADGQKALYEALETNLALEVGDGQLVETPNTLSLVTRLRQICLDPRLIGAEGATSRTQVVKEILREYVDFGGQSVVIFTFFSTYAEILREELARDYHSVIVSGDYTDRERDRSVHDFQTGFSKVLIGTIGSLKEGLDLSVSSTAILTDLPWTEWEIEQVEGRLHRWGQRNDVQVIRLFAPGTIEEHVRDIVSRKERGSHDVLDTKAVSRKAITREVLMEMQKRRRSNGGNT